MKPSWKWLHKSCFYDLKRGQDGNRAFTSSFLASHHHHHRHRRLEVAIFTSFHSAGSYIFITTRKIHFSIEGMKSAVKPIKIPNSLLAWHLLICPRNKSLPHNLFLPTFSSTSFYYCMPFHKKMLDGRRTLNRLLLHFFLHFLESFIFIFKCVRWWNSSPFNISRVSKLNQRLEPF